jgi:peptide/nickel transport system substrate-binding protein
MKKFRFYLALTTTFLFRFRYVLLFGLLIGIGFFLVARMVSPRLSVQTEYIGLTGRYFVDDLPDVVLNEIGEGLTKISDDGQAVPSLAKSWQASDKGKTWTFTLDTTRVWHDGTSITSDDIRYTFDEAVIERPNPETIIFKLPNEFAPFPLIVSRAVFKKGLIGTGDWKVSSITKNGNYIERMTVVNPTNEQKIFRFYPSEERLKTGYKLGEVDRILDVSDPKPFDTWNLAGVSANTRNDRYIAIFLNNDSELFSGTGNKPFRQALNYAIDKEAYNLPRAISPISPDSWSFNPQVKPYDFDQKRATEILTDLFKKNAKPTIHLSTTAGLVDIADHVARDWKAIGIETEVQVVSGVPDNYEAFLATYSIPLDPDQYPSWHSTQTATNISHFKNPRIDKLLVDGRMELDHEKRKKLYLDFQRFLLEESPALFLFHPVSFDIYRK